MNIMKTTNKIISIVLFLLTCLTIHVEGQTRIENINTSEIYEGIADIVASYRIVMEPGFRATQGSIVHAYIGTDENLPPSNTYQPAEGNLVDINDNPTNWNYIKTTTLREPITDEAQIDRSERMVEIEYFNKMGEHEVALLVKASPNQKDIASNAVKFDIGSRVMKSYLSFESDTDDGHSSNPNTAWDDAQYFHQNQSLEGRDGDSRPFSQNKYDNSPLNRNAGEIGIGSHWQSHRTSLKYKCNEQAIVSWKADASGQFVRFVYPTGSLTCEEFTDEDCQKQMVFYDNMGRKVAIEEIGDDGSTLKTVFVYDDMGHLRCVVPPKATSPSNADLCYFYTYDKKGRIVEKTLPDHGRECCVYDRRNRMVMSQDGNLAANGQWAFSLYDVFGRIVVSGLVSSLLSQEQLQSLFDDHSETDEIWNANGSIYGYSGRSFPSTVPLALNGVQNVNWYDSYGFLNLFAEGYDCPNYPSGQVINYDTRTKGALTGFLEKAIMSDGTIDMVHVNYYDAKGQLLCSVNDNHLGGRTNRFFQYNFNGQITEQDVSHTATSQEELLIHSRFVYDHVGRPLKEYYKLGDNDEFIAKAYEYNAIGDLLNTYLFSPDDGTTFAQKLKYHYNIRGWMTKINDFNDPQFDLFALRLNYESANPNLPAQARYNGNISQQSVNGRYCTPSGFGFEYDAHGRLSKAQYAEGVEYDCNQGAFDEQYAFDANGNLATLMRKKDGEFIDKLNCSYYNGTNKLRKVSDLSHSAEGYAYNTETYAYDANGNPIYDPEKHISISYTWLNKPENVEFSDDDHIRYSYTSQGTKLRKEVESRASANDLTTDYCGEFVYEDGELAYIITPFGRIVPVPTLMGTQWRYYYSLTDHLGNVRAEFCAHDSGVPELVQQTDYYPFGLALRSDDYGSIRPNRKLYGGKELQDETLAGYTLNWYDFEARMYNPAIGRFLGIDPLAEKYFNISPYAYCINNPMKFIDPDGEEIDLSEIVKNDQNSGTNYTERIVSSLSEITGLKLSVNSSGRLCYENLTGDETGSFSARTDLIAAIEQKNEDGSPYTITVGMDVKSRGGQNDRKTGGGLIRISGRYEEESDNQTNGLGMAFMHELGHAAFGDKDPKDKSTEASYIHIPDLGYTPKKGADLGGAVSRVNKYRKELGMPERMAYPANPKNGMVPFSINNGKDIEWKNMY